ncbi:MAG: proline--tRNA ligase [Sulfurovum sp.]|nr:proline--tRNA ligase [Sulfurovum sp.]
MRFTQLLIPTSKEAPSDAVLASHIYLMRAGYIQSVGSGLYNFLPLGKRVLDNVRRVAKEELDRAGCQEVDLSFVTPVSLWKESGRFEKYGKELLRFKDRKNNDFVLGPTHEEMMVNMVSQTVRSYKQLPINLYQIKTKFRDEIRPRFGLMRGREFLMKDGYSFASSEDGMKADFDLMEKTYSRIFKRLGLNYRIVEADSGAIGGSASKEFMVIADSGEDTIVICDNCEYAANIEAAKRAMVACDADEPEISISSKFQTIDIKSIDDLSAFFHVDPYYLIKTVAKKALYDGGESKIVLFALRGSDELEETKACNSIDANELVDINEEELRIAGLVAGYMGPSNLSEEIIVVYDEGLRDGRSLICGANEENYHFVGYDLRGVEVTYKDLVAVQSGDGCPKCNGKLKHTKGIEVGHIFQLGTKYSSALKAEFLDENGKSKPFMMGTYGIGISRLLAAIIEQNHDDRGCIWTKESSPFAVHIIISNIKKEEELEAGEELYSDLRSRGIEVLLDDRKERFGFKIKDFELIGVPLAVVVGKNLTDGKMEIITRDGLDKVEIKSSDVLDEILRRLS